MAKGKNCSTGSGVYVPTKKEILDFCDRVLEKWNKTPQENNKNIFVMNAVKTTVLWTNEETLRAVWGEIFRWTSEQISEMLSEKGIQTKQQSFSEKPVKFWEDYYQYKVNPEKWLERYTALSQKYSDLKDSEQQKALYNEYVGLYNVIKNQEGKKIESEKTN